MASSRLGIDAGRFTSLAFRGPVVGEATPVWRLDVTSTGPPDSSPNDQSPFRVRFDWGPMGLRNLAPRVDVVVIVDVLSFTTAVDVALGCGAVVFPYRRHDGSEQAFADENDAVVVGRRGDDVSLSLGPSSLVDIPVGTRLVLPSVNGSALTFGAAEAGASTVVAACLRNAAAVAAAHSDTGATVGVLAAGERWRGSTGPMRVAYEDLLGAGAVLAGFDSGDLSPEAGAAVAAWHEAEPDLRDLVLACASGRELVARGWAEDVAIAAQAHVSDLVPTLDNDRFIDAQA